MARSILDRQSMNGIKAVLVTLNAIFGSDVAAKTSKLGEGSKDAFCTVLKLKISVHSVFLVFSFSFFLKGKEEQDSNA